MELERKTFKLRIDAKSVSDDGSTASFEGYASTFGNEDAYGDVVDPGAFTKTITEAAGTLPMLWQHDTDEVIGIYPAMAEDEHGLKVKGTISLETQRGREAYALLKLGAVKAMSIGFTTVKDVVDAGVRRLKEIRLWEISLVTFPANQAALVTGVKRRNAALRRAQAGKATVSGDALTAIAAAIEQIEAATELLESLLGLDDDQGQPDDDDEKGVDTAALLAEIRKLAEPHTHSAAGEGTTDEKPDESHFKSLVMELRSDVERQLATR